MSELSTLKLYEPQSFLFIERYVGTLLTVRGAELIGLAICAAILIALGLGLRRLSAAMLLGGFAWCLAGVLVMQAHGPFLLATVSATVLAVLIGGFFPRLGHALFAAVLVGLLMRGAGAFIDEELALYTLGGGALLGFGFGMFAWESTPAFVTALVGAFVASFLIPMPGLALEASVITRAGICIALTLFGLWLQFRIGELTWERVRAKFRRKKKK